MFIEGGGAGKHIVAGSSGSWVAEGGAVCEGKMGMERNFTKLLQERLLFSRSVSLFSIFLVEDRLVCSDEVVSDSP